MPETELGLNPVSINNLNTPKKVRMKVTAKICMTKDVGNNGSLFGGNMLAWMDEAAAIFARQVTGAKRVVTLRFAEIIFRKPAREGDIIEFYCENMRPGHTSVTFDIFAAIGGEEIFRTECTFVVVDEAGRKAMIDWAGKTGNR